MALIWVVLAGIILAGAVSAAPAGITSDQKDRLKALAMETRQRTLRQRSELRSARLDLFHVYQEYKLDEPKARLARDRIERGQLSLLIMYLENQISIRTILNEDQFTISRNRLRKCTAQTRSAEACAARRKPSRKASG